MLDEAIKELEIYIKERVEKLVNIKIEANNKRLDNLQCLKQYGKSIKELDNDIEKLLLLNKAIKNNFYINNDMSFIKVIFHSSLKQAYKITLISLIFNENIKYYSDDNNINNFYEMFKDNYKNLEEAEKKFIERKNGYQKLSKFFSEDNYVNPLENIHDEDYEMFDFIKLDSRVIDMIFDTAMRNHENLEDFQTTRKI